MWKDLLFQLDEGPAHKRFTASTNKLQLKKRPIGPVPRAAIEDQSGGKSADVADGGRHFLVQGDSTAAQVWIAHQLGSGRIVQQRNVSPGWI